MIKFKSFIFLNLLLMVSCVPMPDAPDGEIIEIREHGAYILCEGLFGQSNSSLSLYNNVTGTYYNDVLENVNSGFDLGDTANDILIKGDTSFIIVSSNKKIVVFYTGSGRIIKEIYFGGKRYPRKMAMINDSVLAVTDLYDHSFSIINTNSLEIIREHIYTGPAPEGIAVYGNYIFIANSGFGDYLSDEPKAGTISVVDINTLQEIKLIKNVPNVIELKVAKEKGLLYARYNHLPKYQDSVGGIVEYDIHTLSERRRWRDEAGNFNLSPDEDYLYYVFEKGVKRIDLSNIAVLPEFLILNLTDDFWYSISISPENQIWIGNAKNYQSLGEVLIFSDENPAKLLNAFPVGLNPNTIVFF